MSSRDGHHQHRLTVAAFFLALAFGWVGGCQCVGTGFDADRYACSNDRDCSDAYFCVAGYCEANAAVPDAGCAGEEELCGNDVDENCNGVLDDGCPCTGPGRPCYELGLDSPTLHQKYDGGAGCSAGSQACTGGVWAAVCASQHLPQLEFCDGADTDCDGLPDPINCPCQQGRACYQGLPNSINANPAGLSTCRTGRWDCTVAPGVCVGQVLPDLREVCDGFDDDCNGLVDDLADTDPCGPGICSDVFKTCLNGTQPACDLTATQGYSATELCGDGIDNNCDDQVEENCACTFDAGIPCWTGTSSECPLDGGACKGICRRGQQTCGTVSDGGTGYGSCVGAVTAQTENCSNGLDDDCDNLTDCADSSCSGRSCNLTGKTCSGGSCQCVLDAGTAQTSETICNDGKDNDCDGLIDCAEAACAGQPCAAGKVCSTGQCVAAFDGGTVQTVETICNDAFDNDSDGLTDCQDPGCAGLVCGLNGRVCQASACACGGGGTPQATETSCADGLDNDCDGLIDCTDPNCATDAGACSVESNCFDVIDNDGDGKTDCSDTDCLNKKCAAAIGSVCCGTACKNLSTDPANCGGCGNTCPSGACQSVSGTGHTSGRCTCSVGTPCPVSGRGTLQICATTLCDCADDNDKCQAGQTCNVAAGVDYCIYAAGGN